jgi:hypothetical protein
MWKRREILGALATGAAGVALAVNRTDAADDTPGEDRAKLAATMKSCGDICGDCAEACNKAFHHCLEQAAAGKAPHAKMAQITADCAAFCALSAQMISRSSAMMALSCQACAQACARCAHDCETFDTDLQMKVCLDSCKRCEESCRTMVKTMGADPAGHHVRSSAR